MENPLSSVVAVKDLVSCELAGEMVILHLKDGIYYGLNSVGTRIWNLIQEPRTVEEIRGVLLREYDVEEERCGRDLLMLLQELADKGLIQVKNETVV